MAPARKSKEDEKEIVRQSTVKRSARIKNAAVKASNMKGTGDEAKASIKNKVVPKSKAPVTKTNTVTKAPAKRKPSVSKASTSTIMTNASTSAVSKSKIRAALQSNVPHSDADIYDTDDDFGFDSEDYCDDCDGECMYLGGEYIHDYENDLMYGCQNMMYDSYDDEDDYYSGFDDYSDYYSDSDDEVGLDLSNPYVTYGINLGAYLTTIQRKPEIAPRVKTMINTFLLIMNILDFQNVARHFDDFREDLADETGFVLENYPVYNGPISTSSSGLSDSEIAALPRHTYRGLTQKEVRTGETPHKCSICLSEMEVGEELVRLDKCTHRFHFICLEAWLRRVNHCPVCRDSVQPPPIVIN